MTDCLFCCIVDGSIEATIVYEDEHCLAFNDINPKAPTHILIIPRKHIATINDIDQADQMIVGNLFLAAKKIAQAQGFAENGYRVVMNCNQDGGQEVYHIHLHLLAGRKMGWPAG